MNKLKIFFLSICCLATYYSAFSQNQIKPIDKEKNDKTSSPYFRIISDDASVEQLPLGSTSAEVHIAGVIADVTVRQVYKNNGKKPIEAIYVFPGSTRAAVYAMTMTIGERILKAEIQKKEEARATYEKAKKEGKSASLLEQEKPNVFTMNVANIMPGDVIIVEMKYTELLIPENSYYEFIYPTVVGPRYSNKPLSDSSKSEAYSNMPYQHEGEKPTYDFDISIELNTGVPIQEITCSTHKLDVEKIDDNTAKIKLDKSEIKGANKDLIIKYCLSGNMIETGLLMSLGKENFFLLQLQPPKNVEEAMIPPREYLFVVDVSGSMIGFPLKVSKEVINNLMTLLRPEDKFNILLFAGSSEMFSPTSIPATKENIDKALDLLSRQQGGGGTELLSALKRVYDVPKDENYSRTILVITDGYVNVEYEAYNLIRKNLDNNNLFAFGIGTAVNRFIIEGMAKAGNGKPFIITNENEVKEPTEKLVKYLSKPVLTDLKIQYDGFMAYDVRPITFGDIFEQRPIIVYGKFEGDPTGKIVVSGKNKNQIYHVDIPVEKFGSIDTSQALKYLWARNEIGELSDYYAPMDTSRVAKVTDIGLKYNLLTNYTSFVAVDYISRNGETLKTVKQPLPLPDGVTDNAISKLSAGVYSMGNGWNVRGSMAPSQKINELSYSSGSSEDSPLSYSKKGERKINLPDTEPKYDQKKLQSLLLYPEECKNKGIEGRVLLEVKVDKFGKAQKIKIDDSDDKKLDSAAINAVKAITFSPGSVNGVKEEKWIDVPVYFILNPKTKITIDKIFKGSGDKIKAGSWANIKVAIYDYDFNTLLYSNNKGLNISPEILSKSNLLKYVIGMKPGAKYIIFIPADGTDFTLFDNNMIKNNGLIIELDILE